MTDANRYVFRHGRDPQSRNWLVYRADQAERGGAEPGTEVVLVRGLPSGVVAQEVALALSSAFWQGRRQEQSMTGR